MLVGEPRSLAECVFRHTSRAQRIRGGLRYAVSMIQSRAAGLMTDTTTKELQQMAVFGGLSEATLGSLLTHASVVPCAAEHAFFHQGEDGDSFFVLLHGRAEASLEAGGLRYTLRTVAVGDSFGESTAIDLLPRRNSVVALTPCLAMEIDPPIMQRIWQQDLEQITLLHMNIARELSRRLRCSDAQRVEHWRQNKVHQ